MFFMFNKLLKLKHLGSHSPIPPGVP